MRSLAVGLGRQLLLGARAFEGNCGSVRTVKQTTGLVGLDVVPEARSVLRERCQELLKAVQIIPDSAEYRRVVENTYNQRLKLTESSSTDEEIEQEIGFQLEQLIQQAKEELELVPQMAVWQPWDVPDGHKVPLTVEEDVPEGEALPLRKNAIRE
ncbi:hypothetical protein WJX73_010530 [Symbiochloris irregularis]|uniref:Uncharacterized protein n=1 Tax=Symbiochloris irregularis TaxID=706552 RepID=A0AAW1NRB7_9CHLO